MLNEAAYSCTHYVLWTHLHIVKPVSSGYDQAANACSHYVLWTHVYIVKPQSLQVRSAVEMLY